MVKIRERIGMLTALHKRKGGYITLLSSDSRPCFFGVARSLANTAPPEAPPEGGISGAIYNVSGTKIP